MIDMYTAFVDYTVAQAVCFLYMKSHSSVNDD